MTNEQISDRRISELEAKRMAARGIPFQIVVQMGLPDIPLTCTVQLHAVFQGSNPVPAYVSVHTLLPRYSQDTRTVVDMRVMKAAKNLRDFYGVTNTITDTGIVVRTPKSDPHGSI